MNKRSMAVIGMVVVCFVMVGSAAYGYKQADLRQLKEIRLCPNCDLSGANLEGAKLNGSPWDHVNLSGANLSGANLMLADLSGANLSGAI